MATDLTLIQPRHSYAPPVEERPLGHIYFPTGLYMAAARFRYAGADVRIVDENVHPIEALPAAIGISVIGPPYIGAAQRLSDAAREAHANATILVGGQGVRAFNSIEFDALFGSASINGAEDRRVCSALGASAERLQPPESVSLVGELGLISDSLFKLYFSHEFSLYLSQGCRYSCTFCSAVRTHRDPLTGELVRVREQYRSPDVVARELDYILGRCGSNDIGVVSVYLSNLDLFQTPAELEKFIEAITPVLEVVSPKVSFRGLATTQSFLTLHRSQPDLIKRFVELGLQRVGFGIDGATPSVWQGIRKPQSSDTCLKAIQIAAEEYALVPEALMVFGHEGHDDTRSLALAVDTTKRLASEFGAIPRPHVAKGVIPGNDGWVDPRNREIVDFLLDNPDAFQMLDYTCLPSWLTHREGDFRTAVTDAFLEICEMPGTLTQYVRPEDPSLPLHQLEEAKAFNRGKYDI